MQILIDLMQLLLPVAGVITDPSPANVSMLLFTLLMFWLIYYYGYRRFYLHEIKPLLETIENLRQAAVRPTELGPEEHLKELRQAFGAYPMLLPLWQEWEATIYRDPVRDKGILYSSVEADYVFSEQKLLGALGVNLQLYQALPGYLTGLGILGTFWGLTLGLSQVNLSTPDVQILKEGIRNLLGGMGTAFGTSLWGLILSLSWSWYEKRNRATVRDSLAALQDRFNQLITRRAPEAWLAEILTESRAQSSTLTEVSHTLAEAIAGTLERSLNPTFSRLTSAIEDLRQAGTNQLAQAIGDGAGQQLRMLGDSLARVQQTLELTVDRSTDVQEHMRQTMAAQTRSMAETFRQVLDGAAVKQQEMNRQTDQMLQGAAARQREMTEQTGQRLQELLTVIAVSLQQQQAEMAGTMERAGALQQQAGANAASMVQATHEALDLAAAKQQAIAEQTQQTMQQLMALLTESLLRQQGRMESATDRVAADFAARMVQVSQQLEESLQKTTHQAGHCFQEQMSDMSREMKGSLSAFESSVIDNAGRMQQETRAMAETLRQAFDNVVNRYETERDQVTLLLGQVRENMETFRQSAEQTERTAKQFEQAAQPLYDSACQLKTALEQMQQYQDEFRLYISESEHKLRDQLGVSQTSVETIQESLRQTQVSWQAYETKFGVLRTDLEQIFDSIAKGLREYRAITDESLSQFLQLTQNSLTQCVGQLSTVINELSETVEDLYPILENRQK